MNEMEVLRQRAQETPLPTPAELHAARTRLAAAIVADRITSATAVTESDPGGRRSVEPLRLPAPTPVLSAVKLMYGGAVGAIVQVSLAVAYIGNINAYHLTVLGHHLTREQLTHQRPLIATLAIAIGLVVIALWLWMARASGQGRNWARILSTVLFGLATLELIGNHGLAQVLWAILTWLTGLGAVWQLWRPASSAFFKSTKGPAVATARPAFRSLAPTSSGQRRTSVGWFRREPARPAARAAAS
jgi:hypothetical protein